VEVAAAYSAAALGKGTDDSGEGSEGSDLGAETGCGRQGRCKVKSEGNHVALLLNALQWASQISNSAVVVFDAGVPPSAQEKTMCMAVKHSPCSNRSRGRVERKLALT
jgi:hypothetical protein